MASKDPGISESRSDQSSVIENQPKALLKQPVQTDADSKTDKYKSKDAIINWLFCQLCCFYCEEGEIIHNSSSYESMTGQRPLEGYPIKPLKNLRNTCYLNAIIQCLNQTTGVHDKILASSPRIYHLNYEHLSTVSITQRDGPVSQELISLFDDIRKPHNQCIIPRLLLDIVNEENNQFARGIQQDSHEVLRHLLQNLKSEEIKCIQDEIRAQRNANSTSLSDESMNELLKAATKLITPVQEVFGGVLTSTIICRECYTPLQLDEAFFDLQLSIPIADPQVARVQSPSTVSHPKKIGEPGSTPFIKRKTRGNTPLSDGGDIQQGESELSDVGQNFTDVSQSSHKDSVSLLGIKSHSEERLFTPCVNPSDFDSLQNYLCTKGMEYSSTDLMNLSTKDDLEKSLKEFIAIDVLSEEDKFICDTCRERAPYTDKESLVNKQVLIKQLPPVLVLHIKRSLTDGKSLRKDNQHLSFPHVLNMAPYCTNKCLQELQDKNGHIMYGLYGVVVHNGYTLRSGHYVAYVKKRRKRQQTSPAASTWQYDLEEADDDTWYCANDHRIQKCSNGFGDVRSEKAYLLFYELLPRC